jgi:2'-5' RNA ligase
MTSPGPGSYLIIEVPEAEPAVAQHRQRLDPSAADGVPAHITVLGPFMPTATIDAPVLAKLERLFAGASRFRFHLDRTDWFGDEVLWLAPHDPRPFVALTRRVHEAFPGFPPFEGQFGDVVPHLTVGQRHPVIDLRAAEIAVQPHLPLDAHATAVTLITRQFAGGRWAATATFSLR